MGGCNVNTVGTELTPIFKSGTLGAAGNDPYGRVSTTVNCAMLPGETETDMDAGAVGEHDRPSTTGLLPSTICARYPRAIMALRLMASMSVSSGIPPGYTMILSMLFCFPKIQ